MKYIMYKPIKYDDADFINSFYTLSWRAGSWLDAHGIDDCEGDMKQCREKEEKPTGFSSSGMA